MPSDENPSQKPQSKPLPKLEVDPRIEARRNRVRFRRRRRLWITIGVVLAGLAIAYGVSQSSLLDVDEVEVIGAKRTGTAMVLEAAGVEPGAALLGLDLSGPRRSIVALPWVDQVRSSRTWGGKVTFEITEREAVAQVPAADGWAMVDRRGRVLQVTPIPTALPTVLVNTVPEPGGWLHEATLPLLEVSEALIPVAGSGIGPISLANGEVVVALAHGGQAHWGGRDDPTGKATSLATVLDQVERLDCVAKIDLSVPEFPVLTRNENCS